MTHWRRRQTYLHVADRIFVQGVIECVGLRVYLIPTRDRVLGENRAVGIVAQNVTIVLEIRGRNLFSGGSDVVGTSRRSTAKGFAGQLWHRSCLNGEEEEEKYLDGRGEMHFESGDVRGG